MRKSDRPFTMPLLRLKQYTSTIFQRYLKLAEEPTDDEENTGLGKRIRSSYSIATQTVLFFNQSLPDMNLGQWCEKVPFSYLLELDHFISLMEDSTRWAISAIALPEDAEPEAEPLKNLLLADMEELKIRAVSEESDSVTAQFEKTCFLIHEELPSNLRKRKALVRLVWSYLSAKKLTSMARNLDGCDRIDYLRKLTRY